MEKRYSRSGPSRSARARARYSSVRRLPRTSAAGRGFLREEVSRNFLARRSEIALGVPAILSPQPLCAMRHRVEAKYDGGGCFSTSIPASRRESRPRSLSPGRIGVSFPHKTFIYSNDREASFHGFSERLVLENRPARTHRERAAQQFFSRRLCLSHPGSHAGLSAFRPLTLFSAATAARKEGRR